MYLFWCLVHIGILYQVPKGHIYTVALFPEISQGTYPHFYVYGYQVQKHEKVPGTYLVPW